MSRVEMILLLWLACLLYPVFKNVFTTFGMLIFVDLMAHEVYQYAEAFYVRVVGALTVKKRLRSYGRWAVVTGCTRGIGLEFCRQLAELGLDLALVARNPKLLNELALELRTTHGANVVQIVADFSRNDRALYEEVEAQLRKLEGGIGILVNNVGVFYESPRYFHEAKEKDILDTVNVNVTPALLLSHSIIKDHMLPRKKGLVVFIGSASSIRTNPLFNAYAASKAYIDHLARALHQEYKNTGVYVQAIVPFYVATDMAAFSSPGPSFLAPTARTYVKCALAAFGMTPVTSAYFPHIVQFFITAGVPDWFYLYAYRPRVERFRAKYADKLNRREHE